MQLKDNFAKLTQHWAKEDKLKQQIERAQKRLKKMDASPQSNWIDSLIKPLAKELMAATGKKMFDVMGPFGLMSETSIWLFDTEEQRAAVDVLSLTFRPDLHNPEENPFGIKVKDYSNKTEDYAFKTIGAINGMNFPSIIPPADATIEWFVKLLTKNEEVEA